MQYRKKPVVIEAWRWNNQTQDYRPHWLNECGAYLTYDSQLVIPTLEGDKFATPGDWIIKGAAGEIYPCNPEIFAATYEPA